ncbi:MAG: hypothetical protein NT139_03105 [Candidatus Woesearchaeota archaeon]|nr:hypothetical protein [Candidatus Woesearchaeota archaeon]
MAKAKTSKNIEASSFISKVVHFLTFPNKTIEDLEDNNTKEHSKRFMLKVMKIIIPIYI